MRAAELEQPLEQPLDGRIGDVDLGIDRDAQRAVALLGVGHGQVSGYRRFPFPRRGAGHQERPQAAIEIGAGRYYVQGLLCESGEAFNYDSQPFLIKPAIAGAELLNELSSGQIDSKYGRLFR